MLRSKLRGLETFSRVTAVFAVQPLIIRKSLRPASLLQANYNFCKMSEIIEISSNKIFGGLQKIYAHNSSELKCKMNFGVFLPPQTEEGSVPVIYWLSGLACTEANFIQKSGAQKYASEQGVIIVVPDTSPRGLNLPGEEDSWDFGTGAGFYVDATMDPWKNNYRMYSYVTKELPALINEKFPTIPERQSIMGHSYSGLAIGSMRVLVPERQSIMGHSMGGHGALIAALKNPGQYRTVSAFAPISNPSECPWGKKAFSGYLGGAHGDIAWQEYDAVELTKKYNAPPLEILIDQGTEDIFLKQSQLLPENLLAAAKETELRLILRLQEGYDHSYFFIATFIEDHIKHHVKHLKS